ncbi:MAG: nitrous oxide-stimulated promoter family protein [Slackia sp.]|nr:nitrous oxide-stimulated promoter family protein [Slackia sp.]
MNTADIIERSYERLGDAILERFRDKDTARDIVTLAGMAEIYCADHHPREERLPLTSRAVDAGVYPARKVPRLCPECAMHVRYGEVRRALCTRDPRPACKACANHCYAPDEAAWQRVCMAYAGPRAIFRGHAIEALRHLIQTRLR